VDHNIESGCISAGVDWGAVENFVDLKDQLAEFAQIDKEGVDTAPM
jgi:hypothetical protein